MKIPASEIIIRPPVEAYSVLIPVTGGCSWNRCRFCGVYKGIQDYEVRALEDVIESIDFHWAMNPDSKWVFLAGGNATSAPTDFLVEIIKYIKKRFNWVERVSCYSKCLDILKKDDDELKQLAEAGLDIVYMGLESGSKTVLKKMFKGTTDKQIIEVGKRLLKAGIKVSLYIILGLGSYELSEDHVKGTAYVLTEINPTIFRFRTLNVMPNSPLWEDVQSGKFIVMKPVDILKEERDIIKLLGENVTSQVYNDHVSNYCSYQTRNIKKDRDLFIKELNRLINDPEIQKMEPKWLTSM